MAKGRNPEGFRHFGAALHVLEDYFAHSNFVELALRKVGYSKVLAWTSPAHCKHKYPIVTGMFDSEDVIASTAGVIAELLFPVEWEFKRLKPGERTPSDKTTLILLGEHEDKRYLDGFNTYLKLRDVKLSVPGSEYIDMALHYTVGMHANATNFLFSSLVHLVGNSVDDTQTTLKSDPNTNGSTDPTHSQLAKDHDNHAFHTLAAGLAKIAVLDVGKAMSKAWKNVPNADPANVARAYFVHPNDTTLMDSEVLRWARANPSNLKRGESSTEWQALRAEHEKEVREKIQQTKERSQQFWEYNNKHYKTLFGEKNQVKK